MVVHIGKYMQDTVHVLLAADVCSYMWNYSFLPHANIYEPMMIKKMLSLVVFVCVKD